MMMRMIPNVFYEDVQDGLDLFVEGLGFQLIYQEAGYAVVLRDNAKLFLVHDPLMAAQPKVPMTMETNTIEADHDALLRGNRSLLHPDFNTVVVTEWGGRQFGVVDAAGNCVMIRQYDR